MATRAVTCGRGPTEDEKRRRGEELVTRVSSTIAAAQALGFSAEETRERLAHDGERRIRHVTREVKLRRPDRLWFRTSGDRNAEGCTKANS
jgi:hypothetical protein